MAVRPPSLKTADFQRALSLRPVSRTQHFTLHVLPATPPKPGGRAVVEAPSMSNLSTDDASAACALVDDEVLLAGRGGWQRWRLGLVLPKKQARRSVTRSLIRHQAREALRRHAPAVAAIGRYGPDTDGWVVRLRAPFDIKLFPSAASTALQGEVRRELDALWARLTAPPSEGAVEKGKSATRGLDPCRGAA
jgi:ribonuclease P protein component